MVQAPNIDAPLSPGSDGPNSGAPTIFMENEGNVRNMALILLPSPNKGASYNGAPAPLIGRCAFFFPANGPFFELFYFLPVNSLFTDQWPFCQTMVFLVMDFFLPANVLFAN